MFRTSTLTQSLTSFTDRHNDNNSNSSSAGCSSVAAAAKESNPNKTRSKHEHWTRQSAVTSELFHTFSVELTQSPTRHQEPESFSPTFYSMLTEQSDVREAAAGPVHPAPVRTEISACWGRRPVEMRGRESRPLSGDLSVSDHLQLMTPPTPTGPPLTSC